MSFPFRTESPRGVHQCDEAAGGGFSWARRLLVSVCCVEPSRHLQESEGICPHSLWVEKTLSCPQLCEDRIRQEWVLVKGCCLCKASPEGPPQKTCPGLVRARSYFNVDWWSALTRSMSVSEILDFVCGASQKCKLIKTIKANWKSLEMCPLLRVDHKGLKRIWETIWQCLTSTFCIKKKKGKNISSFRSIVF